MPRRRTGFLLLVSALVWLGYGSVQVAAQTLAPAERQQLSRALAALGAGNLTSASSLAQGLPAPLPTAVYWWGLAQQENPPASFDALVRFREERPDWPRPNALAARTEQAALTAPPADVARHLSRFAPTTPEGRWAAARALAALGDTDTAAAFARAAWRDSGSLSAGEETRLLQEFGTSLRPEDHQARLDALAWRGLSREAQSSLPFVDEGYRRLIEARLALRAGQPGAEGRASAVPPSLQADPGLLYERARYRRRAGDSVGAAAILLSPPANLGNERRWYTERRIAYREALDAGNYAQAYRLAASNRQSRGSGFADAEWHAGWLALRFLNRPADARAHFERMWDRVDTPISRGRAAYWAGRAAAAQGDEVGVQRWYDQAAAHGITFYGQEATRELGRTSLDLGQSLPGGGSAVRSSEVGQLALMLGQVDDTLMLPTVARSLVDNAQTPAELGDAIRLAQEVGRYDAAIGGYIPLYRQGVLSAAASHPVPRAFDGLLQPLDSAVSPAMALAIARQESRFVRNAVSPAGARGLMQLMPGTARDVARQLGVGADIGRLTRDGDYNAQLGTKYLGDLLRRFDDPALAAAGYNAGPGRSVQWIERYGDPRQRDRYGYIDWLEMIPFSETRNYVQRVLEGERVYQTLVVGG